jgi:uncharacterized protein YjbI with pentapeptide repeats
MTSTTYENATLRGRSFKGKNLSGINFSNADIRGTNFTNSTLTGANFAHTQAGLVPFHSVGLIVGSLILVAIAGLVIGLSSAFPAFIAGLFATKNTTGKELLTTFGLSILASFIWIIIRQGLAASLVMIAVITAIMTAIVVYAGGSDISATAVLQAAIIAMIMAGVLVMSLSLSIILSITTAKALALPVILALAIAIVGGKEGIKGTPFESLPISISLCITGFISITLIGLSVYISIQAMYGDPKYRLIRVMSISLCASLGTSFRGANLTDADFTQAALPYTDFRKATLKRTSWLQSRKLDLSRVEGTYLEKPSLRHLVVSRDGHGNVYDYTKLQGLNLQSANLVDTSFIGVDLSESNLEGANLSKAILAEAKLYGANISNAILTGACIEDWAISTDLIYDNISCDEIFMRLITHENKNSCRKPDDWNEKFQPGDFADFIFPYIDRLKYYTKANEDPRKLGKQLRMQTMDLFHYNEFNSSAALIALKKLAEENPLAELDVLSLEVLGDEKVHLKIAIRGQGDAANLNIDYRRYYADISRFSNYEIKQRLELIVNNSDNFSRLVSIFTLPRGDSIINISVGRDLSGVLNLGTIIGDISNDQ